jgi:transcriptional regulator with XRE-family HTH domain
MPDGERLMSIGGAQVKEARKLLGWTLKTLEGKSGVAATLIANFEADKGRLSVLQLTVLRRVIEAGGVAFTDEQPGVKKNAAAPTISDEAALPDIPDDDPYDGAPV